MSEHAVCLLCRCQKSWINIGVRTPRSGMAAWVDIRCTRTGNPLCGRSDTGLLYNPAMRDR